MARSITDPYRQARALAQVAGALAGAGQHQPATARRTGRDGGPLDHRPVPAGRRPGAVAGALAAAGQHHTHRPEQAETVARSITDPYLQADALVQVARALASAGQQQQAEEWPARSPTLGCRPALWRSRRGAGQGRAAAAGRDVARAITDPGRQTGAGGGRGRPGRAGQYQQAETVARSITDPGLQAGALAQVADALAQAGQQEQAESGPLDHRPGPAGGRTGAGRGRPGQGRTASAGRVVARSITNPDLQADALAEVAGALAEPDSISRP